MSGAGMLACHAAPSTPRQPVIAARAVSPSQSEISRPAPSRGVCVRGGVRVRVRARVRIHIRFRWPQALEWGWNAGWACSHEHTLPGPGPAPDLTKTK